MKQDKQKTYQPPRNKKRPSNLLFIPILVIVVIGILFFLTANQEKDSNATRDNQTGIWGKITRALSDDVDLLRHVFNPKDTPKNGQAPVITATQPAASEDMNRAVPATGGEQPAAPTSETTQQAAAPSGSEGSPGQPVDKINAFYTHLDAQPYVQAFHLEKPSNVYFRELIQKVLDNPPVITRETDDLLTVVKNTAHFFRVLGKNNIIFLKAVLEHEKPSLEDMLADYYSLAETPDGLEKSLSLRIPPNALYDYAGFFLNTMGGRLYLFRRDPATRMTVTYYAILLIDTANRQSNNREGIQIKQAVDSLIADIEGSGNQLRFKERYLDKLYELKEKYQ